MDIQTQTQTPPKVQHITKASSDKILRKFAEVDSDSDTEGTGPVKRKSTSKRPRLERKNKGGIVSSSSDSIIDEEENSPSKENINININNINQSGSLLKKIERKSLLPQQINNRRSSSSSGTLLRKFGISKSHSRGFRHKSVLGAIEKTWSKAIRGASKVFMEKHYNRHRILNSDLL